MRLSALVASRDGPGLLRQEIEGPLADAESLGRRVAEALRENGAQAILDEIRAMADVPAPPAP